MNLVIIEDEFHAVKRLEKLLNEKLPSANILAVIETVEEGVDWFENNPKPDLVFMDIHLADGLSFNIFEEVKIDAPIIFTTAYDKYAIRAFQVNSIDYLLKPIDVKELERALGKFKHYSSHENDLAIDKISNYLKQSIKQELYRDRFLLKKGDSYTFVSVENITLFFSEESITFLMDDTGKKHIYDVSLNQLEKQLNPKVFFRVSRKHIVHINAIQNVSVYFKGRVKLMLKGNQEVIVSRDRTSDFRNWLDGLY